MSNTSLLGSFGGQAGDALMFRNKLANGCMRVWQRTTSFTTAGGLPDGKGVYNSADRWKFLSTINGVGYYNVPVNRSTDAPTGFIYSASVGSHYGTTDHLGVMQPIEGINCVELAESGVCTISVYLKKGANAPAGKNITISLVQCKTTDVHGNFIDDVAINYDVLGTQVTALDSLASWTRVTFTVSGLTANVARGLGVCFYISAIDLSPGNDIFKFTGASLEAGPTATPFERRPIGVELGMCQRYYWKLTGNPYTWFGTAHVRASDVSRAYVAWQLPVTMRTKPALGYSGVSTINASRGFVSMALDPNIGTDRVPVAEVVISSGWAEGVSFTLGASNNATSYVDFSAEL